MCRLIKNHWHPEAAFPVGGGGGVAGGPLLSMKSVMLREALLYPPCHIQVHHSTRRWYL